MAGRTNWLALLIIKESMAAEFPKEISLMHVSRNTSSLCLYDTASSPPPPGKLDPGKGWRCDS